MEATFHDGVTINVCDVIVLARKSQVIKGRAATSIESQDEDAREWAESQGLNVVQTVPDVITGKKAMWERPKAKPWVTQPDLMIKYQAIVHGIAKVVCDTGLIAAGSQVCGFGRVRWPEGYG
jgi:hypothetical protein